MTAPKVSFFFTKRERAALDERFKKDMKRLRQALAIGCAPGESKGQFADRMMTALEAVLDRHRFTSLRLPSPKGRPPTLIPPPPSRRAGRPTEITPEAEEWFVADIDRRKAKLAATRRPATDSAALRWSIKSHYVKHFREKGLSESEVLRRAKEMADGPLFTTRQATLARLRNRARNRPG